MIWSHLVTSVSMSSGVVFAAQYYVPHPTSELMLTEVTKWLQIISGFALVLGVTSLFHIHAVKIRRKEPGWAYSLILDGGILGTIAAGFSYSFTAGQWVNGKETINGIVTAFGWIYSDMMVPLQGTMFAILAFFIASAAYRSFRARSREAALLLIAALIVMMVRVPLVAVALPVSGGVTQSILNEVHTDLPLA